MESIAEGKLASENLRRPYVYSVQCKEIAVAVSGVCLCCRFMKILQCHWGILTSLIYASKDIVCEHTFVRISVLVKIVGNVFQRVGAHGHCELVSYFSL